MKVSVIIPAYNAEKYLVETLESVVHQTLDDYEVIVVNDGSKDGTIDILRKYEEKYPNFNVIDKENEGVSAARNDGIEKAKGEFLFFFDSDDILELDALESLYNRAISTKAELVIAGYDIFDSYTTTRVNDINSLIAQDKIDRYDELILQTFSLSNKLFKKDIINKYNFRLPPISYSEDGAFLMRYVYNVSKIVGLEQIIFHYRRMNGEGNAITESISDSKVRDYIEAHRLILESAKESIVRDFPQYGSIEEIKANNAKLRGYMNRIIFKELNILIRQFYSKFWKLEEETISVIVNEIQDKLMKLDLKHISLIADENPDVDIFNLCARKEDAVKRAYFTAVLYGTKENKEDFAECLNSIVVQNLVGTKIIVPEAMKDTVQELEMADEHIIFEKADSEKGLFYNAIKNATTKYVVFCNPKIIYANNAFKFILKRFIKSNKDFVTELIYHNNFGEAQPVYLNRIAQESFNKGLRDNPALCMDRVLANKFFDVDFIKRCSLDTDKELIEQLDILVDKGSYAFFNDGIVLYNDDEQTFLDFVETEGTREYVENYFIDKEADLNDEDIVIDPGEAFVKLLDTTPNTFADRVMKWAISHYSKKPVIDRVLFVTIRKDGELEGNAKALYPYVKGEKVICAAGLPHGIKDMVNMIKLITTSKVIVTDDYVKYLRHFDLKPEQRVIQLWHACGAFKKFGQRGTNMTIKTDMATHAQYNIACVSGEHIRPVYADAFNINLKKVKALGCPRTDDFFNQELIEEKKTAIYVKYPELKDKFVIIYAPTFRDVGEGRSQFNPQIDFDKLSQNLLPNQEFIICPHPVMKNDIIPRKYKNIRVLRDFSTNDLMFISDMLITDYSSVIFEYALLQKPIAFFCYDLSVYNRGFYLKYPEDLPGDVYENQEELEAYLTSPEKHVITDKYNLFVQKYMAACDGHSCERIAGIINSYMEGK